MLEEEELKDAALIVFANKQDLPNALPSDVIAEKLGLGSLCAAASRRRPHGRSLARRSLALSCSCAVCERARQEKPQLGDLQDVSHQG